MRIAAVGDFHWANDADTRWVAEIAAEAAAAADILLLLGDLTTHGNPWQMEGFGRAFTDVRAPVLAVLGNHDYESGGAERAKDLLGKHGIAVLDGDGAIVNGIGFAGTKGFGGGFGGHAIEPFGEPGVKSFVDAAVEEQVKLERALRKLGGVPKVVLLHYSPTADTLGEEPEQIWPFLGSSRLLKPIEAHQVSVVFHGHAHHGTAQATTPSGVPVFNVALPVLDRAGMRFQIWETCPLVSCG